jgi:uncharacterized protein YbjT (DUF2867 family)
MSSEKKIIAVVGSTGTQGGSVVRSLLADGTFAVRALTRKVDGEAAQKLKAAGVEVVAADLEDVESLKKAFKGAYGVFGVTDFWALYLGVDQYDQAKSRDHETQLGKNIVDAAEALRIQHFVWSTLDDSIPAAPEVYHFVSKYAVDKYLKTKSVPTTYLLTSVYFNNASVFGWVKKEGDVIKVDISIPYDVPVPWYDANETGDWVVPVFKNPNEWIGKYVHAYGSSNTPEEFAEALKKKTGKNVVLNKVTTEQFVTKEYRATLGEELWLNNNFIINKGIVRDAELSKRINPNASDLEKWVEKDQALHKLISS